MEEEKKTIPPITDDRESVGLFIEPKKRKLVVLGIFSVIVIGALSTAAINTILPVIAEEIGGLQYFSLVFVAGTFGSVIFTPIAGGMGDKFNRKNLFLVSSILVSISMFFHTIVTSMELLIVLRVVVSACLGVALVTGLSYIGLIFPAKERMKWIGYYGTMTAAGSFAGPLLGGYLTSSLGWRSFFYFTVLLAFIGILVFYYNVPNVKKTNSSNSKLDFGGIGLYAILLLSIISLSTFGGKMFDWLSLTTIILIGLILILGTAFVLYEKHRKEKAFMSIDLFKNANFSLAFVSTFLSVACKLPFYMYLALYLQNILGYTVAASSVILSVFGITAVIFSLIFAPFISKTGYVKQSALIAVVVLTSISALCWVAASNSFFNVALLIGICILWGAASTVTNTIFIMIIQTTLPREFIGIATGNIQLEMALGSMIPVSI